MSAIINRRDGASADLPGWGETMDACGKRPGMTWDDESAVKELLPHWQAKLAHDRRRANPEIGPTTFCFELSAKTPATSHVYDDPRADEARQPSQEEPSAAALPERPIMRHEIKRTSAQT